MPANQQKYIVPTGVLFYILNINRQTKELASVEEALISRKLGILFTFKTNHYINFKEEIVLLDDEELLILAEIINEYFNVDMGHKINQIAIKSNDSGNTHKQLT